MKDKFILDASCGPKEMWFNKNHPNTIYIDYRRESKGFYKHRKNLEVQPDMIMDFRALDFKDKSFKLVVWDPPHLSILGQTSIFRKKYGALNRETWPFDLKKGFDECWRVLEDYGVLVFKWSNSEISFEKVLSLFPVKPLFGNISKNTKTSITKHFVFMKIPGQEK